MKMLAKVKDAGNNADGDADDKSVGYFKTFCFETTLDGKYSDQIGANRDNIKCTLS